MTAGAPSHSSLSAGESVAPLPFSYHNQAAFREHNSGNPYQHTHSNLGQPAPNPTLPRLKFRNFLRPDRSNDLPLSYVSVPVRLDKSEGGPCVMMVSRVARKPSKRFPDYISLLRTATPRPVSPPRHRTTLFSAHNDSRAGCRWNVSDGGLQTCFDPR